MGVRPKISLYAFENNTMIIGAAAASQGQIYMERGGQRRGIIRVAGLMPDGASYLPIKGSQGQNKHVK